MTATTTSDRTLWQEEGFGLVTGVLTPGECDAAVAAVESASRESPGDRRLLEQPWCRVLAKRLLADTRLRHALPSEYVATACTFFSKSTMQNWLVPLHQDLSIAVAGRVSGAALGGWSQKDGITHVQPPATLLARLVAVRVHLDDCGEDDGPLHVVPGSHRHGRLTPADAMRLREKDGYHACIARRGDAWFMRPLLLHASSKASGDSCRRVLHYVFGPTELPYGLRWHATF